MHIKSKNVGKVPIEAGKDGLTLTVRRLPVGLNDGFADMEKSSVVFKGKIDLMKIYGGYTIEPGAEQEDMGTFILPNGGTYILDAEFDLGAEGKDPTIQNAFAVVKIE